MDIEDQIFLSVAYAETRGAKVAIFCRDWQYVRHILHEATSRFDGKRNVQARLWTSSSGGFVKIITGADASDGVERICGLQLTHVFIDEIVYCSEREERLIAARMMSSNYSWSKVLYANGARYIV